LPRLQGFKHDALVKELAKQLRSLGMQVEVEPSRGRSVDLVAFKAGEAPILVEVKARGVSAMDIARLAEAAEGTGLKEARLYVVAPGPISRGALTLASELGVRLVSSVEDLVKDLKGG